MEAPLPPHARYHGRAMVTTRKPKSDPAAKRRSPAKRAPDSKRGAPRKRETLEEKFERILAEPVDAPFPKLTKREARYFLRRLAGSKPDAPRGVDVIKNVRGDWSRRYELLTRDE